MITVKEIERNIVERHKGMIAQIEKAIDAHLDAQWEKGERKITYKFESVPPREVIDHIAQMYRGVGKWNVELRSSTGESYASPIKYDMLVFEQYKEIYFPDR